MSDFRALVRLVGECRDLGDDSIVWRRHWFRGVSLLTGADIGMGGEVVLIGDGQVGHLGATDWGYEKGFNRAGWEAAVTETCRDPTLGRTEPLRLYFQRFGWKETAALARSDLMADREWERSWNYQHLQRVVGVNHTVWCYTRIPLGNARDLSGLLLSRAEGRPDFTGREKAILRELHAMLAPLIGGPLARFTEPAPSALPLRTRQVLRCLLEGDSDKQVAVRLGMSRHTVNGHTKLIFRHFGVQTRAELLARWIRRGWGSRFAWLDIEIG